MSSRTVRLTPMRRHIAAIITIALSTGFIAVMLLGGALLQQSVTADSAASLRGADLVATVSDDSPRTTAPTIDGATSSWPYVDSYVTVTAGDARATGEATMLPPAAAIDTPLVSGRDARTAREIVIEQRLADALHVNAGDTIDVTSGGPESPAIPLTVVGIARGTDTGLIDIGPGRLLLTEKSAAEVLGANPGEMTTTWYYSLPGGADADAIAAAHSSTDGLQVRTAQQIMDEREHEDTNDFAGIGVVIGAFVLVALATAGVVVANTFSVTIAQRIRDLALLRTLGATGRQVAATVLRESLRVGIIGSLAGIALGYGIVQTALALAAVTGWVPQLVVAPFSVPALIVPLIAGLVITLLASLAPLRRATSVTPLAALRAEHAEPMRQRRLTASTILSLLALVGGGALLAAGVLIARNPNLDNLAGFAVLGATAGGAISLVGILLGLRAVVAPLMGVVGRIAAPIGRMPARIAAANARRNPGRSAATVAALVIGTTLMATMAVGASTAQTSLTEDLANRKPIDLVVDAQQMPADAAEQIRSVDGIAQTEPVRRGEINVGADDTMTVYGATPEQIRATAARPEIAQDLTGDALLTGEARAERFGLHDGQRIAVPAAHGTSRTLTVHVVGNLDLSLTSADTLSAIVGDASTPAVFASLEPGLSTAHAVDAAAAVQKLSRSDGYAEANVSAEGVERGMYAQVLQILLGITVGLLAVAVIVALVGVANTLSLGVIERTSENALLRALGTTRAQMRGMLGWEGVMLGLIGAVIGIAVGCTYGVLGVAAVLGTAFPLVVSIPWIQLAVLVVLSVAAGWVASVMPARRAARTAPAQALAA